MLPGHAEAIANFRILQGDSRASVMQHAWRTVDDTQVTLREVDGAIEPSGVSSTAAPSFQLVARTVRELFPGTVVAPGLMIGGTDSRHFQAISSHIYRFSPVRAGREDLARFHGTNERIAVTELADLVRFYHRLLDQAGR